MKVKALQPIRFNNKRIEVGEEIDVSKEIYDKKLKDKGLVEVVQFEKKDKGE
jgi:hypothetical protein